MKISVAVKISVASIRGRHSAARPPRLSTAADYPTPSQPGGATPPTEAKCAHGMGRRVVERCGPLCNMGFELGVQPTRRATSTIAEVICEISSPEQMYGGIA